MPRAVRVSAASRVAAPSREFQAALTWDTMERIREMAGLPESDAPSILNRSYTITAEVDIPGGASSTVGLAGGSQDTSEGMIVTMGGRFGGYGLYLLKGKPVFTYNFVDLERYRWEAQQALTPGKHTIVFDFKPDGPGLGSGGTGVLSVDGKEVARNSLEHTTPITFPEDETFDIGQDTRTGVALVEYRYDAPFKFTGKIDKLTIAIEPPKLTPEDEKKLVEDYRAAQDAN